MITATAISIISAILAVLAAMVVLVFSAQSSKMSQQRELLHWMDRVSALFYEIADYLRAHPKFDGDDPKREEYSRELNRHLDIAQVYFPRQARGTARDPSEPLSLAKYILDYSTYYDAPYLLLRRQDDSRYLEVRQEIENAKEADYLQIEPPDLKILSLRMNFVSEIRPYLKDLKQEVQA